MTRFYVEVADEPDILDIVRNGRTRIDWIVISERRYDHEQPGLLRNWLFEITCWNAPASVADMLIRPVFTRYFDESVSVDYRPSRAVYPRLDDVEAHNRSYARQPGSTFGQGEADFAVGPDTQPNGQAS